VIANRALPADPVRPLWSSSSALVYLGGFVSLVATGVLLGIASDDGGDAALIGAALLAFALAFALAEALVRARRAIAAGVAATLAVVFAGAVVAAILDAVGALDVEVSGWQPFSLVVEATLVAAALAGIARYRAPLLVLPVALVVWAALADLSSLFDVDNGGELLSIVAGALLVVAGIVVDRAGREPYAFWLHAIGGLAVGGALAVLAGDEGWVLTAAVALGFVAAGFALGRSSYTVLGAIGVLIATTLFAVEPLSIVGGFFPFFPPGEGSTLDDWQIALAYLVAGLVLGAIGVLGRLTWPGRTGPAAPPATHP
jgi:hypothetical protein